MILRTRKSRPRDRDEDEWQESEATLLRILQTPPIHVWTCDTQCRVTAVLYSSPYSQVYSDPRRFIGGTDFDWLKPEEAEAAMAVKRRCVETRAASRGGFSCTWDGKLRYFDLMAVPNIDDDGEMRGITCFVLDVTEEIDWIRRLELMRKEEGEDSDCGEPSVTTRMESLSQRLRLLIKRPQPQPLSIPHDVTEPPPLVLDEEAHGLKGPLQDVRLSRTEWRLISCLMQSRGRVLTHMAIIDAVWGPEYRAAHHLVHDAISRLRHRFETAGLDSRILKSVHGVGYMLTGEPVSKERPSAVLPALVLGSEVALAAPVLALL
ncbi:MAG: PAS domain-containing protein [Dehalococcoidia bacterium]|nr:PAS domain-containing protein [Dehalococcoidia bacterium]